MEIKDYYTRINFGDRSECVNIINCSIDDNFDEHGVYREKDWNDIVYSPYISAMVSCAIE